MWHAVRLGPKITDTVKGKLSLGARILQVGGVQKVFKQLFSAKDGEKLLKASQCYLSTTSGPIAGLLFISTDKVAFCSERSIKITSPKGELIRVHYKVIFLLFFLFFYNVHVNDLNLFYLFFQTLLICDLNLFVISGLHSTWKDKACQPKSKCGESFTKVHRNGHRGWFRLLVYGFHKLSESFKISSAGYLSSSEGKKCRSKIVHPLCFINYSVKLQRFQSVQMCYIILLIEERKN